MDKKLETERTFVDKCIKDKNGKVALGQFPNLPLILWAIFRLVYRAYPDKTFSGGCSFLADCFLFLWAYLELTSGVNYFRRVLGLIVMIMIVTAKF